MDMLNKSLDPNDSAVKYAVIFTAVEGKESFYTDTHPVARETYIELLRLDHGDAMIWEKSQRGNWIPLF